MAIIQSFKGFRPPAQWAAKVASRPYDVMNRAEAKAEAAGNPYSFLQVIRSEIGFPNSLSAYDDQVYAAAKTNFDNMVANGILIQDDAPCLYIYAQEMNGKRQTGLVTGTAIQDYLDDHIKKHEFTRPTKEKDRITHIGTTRLQTGPVLMAYPQVAEIDVIVNTITHTETPTYDFVATDDIRHILWVVNDDAVIKTLIALFDSHVPNIYIADGHHRAASSTKVGTALKNANPNHTGTEDYNYFLSVLFPDNQLQIIDYNRVVKDLNGLSKTDFLKKIQAHFNIELRGNTPFKPAKLYDFGMYLDSEWYALTAHPETYATDDAVAALDISILSDYLLAPILGIADQRTDDRIDFVGGIRGLAELERRVNSGEMRLAFAIHPVSIAQLIDVANSGKVMPPKSTWFEPKLRSGLVVRGI